MQRPFLPQKGCLIALVEAMVFLTILFNSQSILRVTIDMSRPRAGGW